MPSRKAELICILALLSCGFITNTTGSSTLLCFMSAAPKIMPAVCAGGLVVMIDGREGAQPISAGMVLRGRESQSIECYLPGLLEGST